MVNWLIVIGIGVVVVGFASIGRLPFTERKLATTEETRTAVAFDSIPKFDRQQAISLVADDIRANCRSADKYLPNTGRFEATWMRVTWTDDHHQRGDREWTVTDPLTHAKWRMYEETGEVIEVLGDC
ncbi:MAG: hypothetical protein QGG09_04385 [Pirellulaceae bacterium]|nr:hypothetical protein [Pirellulaceae bacterium]